MSVLLWIAGGCLFIAAALTITRIVRGPTVLNRALATDVLVSVMICVVGMEAVVFKHTTTLPILISLSLVGFVGSVAVARFVARDRDPDPDTDDEGASARDLPQQRRDALPGERR